MFDAFVKSNWRGLATKMLPVRLTDLPEGENLLYCMFRGKYYVQSFNHKLDYVLPIGEEATRLYDCILAAGEYDGFKTNENDRIKAILWRILLSKNPISEESRSLICTFLDSKLSKTIKFASLDPNGAQIIKALVSLGVINNGNEKKVQKSLAKAESEAVKQVAAELNKLLENAVGVNTDTNSDNEGISALEEKYQKAYKKLNPKAVLLKQGFELPEVTLITGEPAPREYLEIIVAVYTKSSKIDSEIADEIAKKLDTNSFKQALWEIYNSIQNYKKQIAFLPTLFRYSDGEVVVKEYRRLLTKYNEAQMNQALYLSDTREAMLIAEKNNELHIYASLRNVSEDWMRDHYLSDVGLDENGCKAYDLGNQIVAVRMLNDLSFVVDIPGKNKPAKPLPKKGSDEDKYVAANADFSKMKKDAKKIVKSRANKLFEDFLSGRQYEQTDWVDVFIGNPVLRILANTIIWEQSGSTFVVDGKSAISSKGNPFIIQAAQKIKVAHPMEMSEDEVSRWQEYFRGNGLKQPFEQIWEPVTNPDTISEDRYKGCEFFWRRAQNAEKYGIHFYDYDFHNDVGFTANDCQLENWITNPLRHDIAPDATFSLGKFKFKKYTRAVNHIVYIIDKWTIWDRIRKNDMSVMDIVDRYTVAQITDFITIGNEAGAADVTAALMDYKHEKFPEYDAFDVFTLED